MMLATGEREIMVNETTQWLDAVVSIEMANPSSALSQALVSLGGTSESRRLLCLAFYRLGIADGAIAQISRSSVLMEPGA